MRGVIAVLLALIMVLNLAVCGPQRYAVPETGDPMDIVLWGILLCSAHWMWLFCVYSKRNESFDS